MNIEHIKDEVAAYGFLVALMSYQLGMEHSRKFLNDNVALPESDDIQDQLRQIAKDILNII